MTGATLVHYAFLLAALACFFLAFLRWKISPPGSPGVHVGWLGVCFVTLDVLIFGAMKL